MAAAPSPRPVSPRPSVVVADKLTEAPPKAEARTAWASSRRGAIRGRWLMIWTDDIADHPVSLGQKLDRPIE